MLELIIKTQREIALPIKHLLFSDAVRVVRNAISTFEPSFWIFMLVCGFGGVNAYLHPVVE